MRHVAVVTGGRQGIGRCVAETLARQGWDLGLIDLESSARTIAAIHACGVEALDVIADVSDPAGVELATRNVLDRFGHVDALVNNAGISLIVAAEDTGFAQWRRVLDVNLTGPFLLSRAFGQHMLQRRRGAIVNVASIAGLRGFADRAAYNASKHGLIGLTRTLAAEWGGRGIRVNAVCPSWVKTEMDDADQAGGGYTDADITETVPLGRFATPDDVARAIAFLLDDRLSGFVNGHSLSVDGGWSADGSWRRLRLSHR
ncbi:MAG TPA: SDR family oxidoreductase [Candidatus Eisenbacteria bacterium]|nr:SDR family oxidoreductase [Candidatus Eisenbacteria bacterium]